MKDQGDPFKKAHAAAIENLKKFCLLKNFSGKLTWITLTVFTLFIVIATGRFEVLALSAICGVFNALGYYLTKLSEYLRTESEKRAPDEGEGNP